MTSAQAAYFCMGFNDFKREVYENNVRHGFTGPDIPFNAGEKIALMHSELSEALEYERKGNGKSDHIPQFSGVEEEFADVIIRIMDYAAHKGLDVAGAVAAKHEFNLTRPFKHGGKAF